MIGPSPAETERFAFGENWQRFLAVLSPERIAKAEQSLADFLQSTELSGKTFLDVGSGSGLFSLAARRLGAQVHSFDYDLQSVACTRELRRRFCDTDPLWTVEQGSILDERYVAKLGRFDIVYAWGVLHHTGDMARALEMAGRLVKPGGLLFVALYNDQGLASRLWRVVKRMYCLAPSVLRPLIVWPAAVRLWGPTLVKDTLRGRPLHTWREHHQQRGMSPWHDVIDWVGGYPFEVAQPQEITRFYEARGFQLQRLDRRDGRGCNEYLFRREK